jgi:hypothetical protein
MILRSHLSLAVLVAITILGCAAGMTSTAAITETLTSHVRYLADDSLEGRLVGTPGILKAAKYIRTQFTDMGLEPAFDGSYYQEFEIRFGTELVGEPSLVIGDIELSYPEDFAVLPISAGAKVAGEAIISAGDLPEDLESVTGSIIFCIEEPELEQERWTMMGRDGVLEWMRSISLRAAEHGAVAVVFVAGTPDAPLHAFAERRSNRPLSIPAFEITYAALDRTLGTEAGSRPGTQCEAAADVATRHVGVTNVGGLVRGKTHPDEYIVVGAHYDHLGYGDIASSTPWRREVHNGADDNASGVAALIEIARKTASGEGPERSVVFACFTAEELGALGSEYYVSNPPYPIDATVAMINLDTVGRLEEGKLIAFGARSAAEFNRILIDANTGHSLKIVEKQEIYGFSDQNPFYARGVPALHFFTGAHDDYHSPDDDWQRLNYEGLGALTEFITDFTLAVAAEQVLTPLVDLEDPSEARPSRGKGAFLGIIPDFAYGGTGVGIKGAVPESPAELAGLEDGDVIVGIDGKPITDLRGLMRFLEAKSPGDTVEIQVTRGLTVGTRKATLSVRAPKKQSE